MVDVTAPAQRSAGQDARLAWMIGGGMLAAYAVLQLVQTANPGLGVPAGSYVSELLWAGALLIFAFGVRRQGSVVGRNPFGITVLVIAAIVPLAADLVWNAVIANATTSVMIELPVFGSAQYESSDDGLKFASTVDRVIAIVSLVVPIVVGVVIGRARVLPPRWRWLPLVVLALIPALQLLGMLVAATPGDHQAALTWLAPVHRTISTLSTVGFLLLGILAIVFAKHAAAPAEQATQVYSSED